MCDDVIQFSSPIFYLFAIHDVSIVWNVESNFVISKFFSLFSWLLTLFIWRNKLTSAFEKVYLHELL